MLLKKSMMNKNITKSSILIVAATLLGIGTIIINSGSHVSATSAEAKTHLDEGLKALQSGDTDSAMTHLNAADEQLSAGEAKTHLDEGLKALQSGDTDSAMTHVKAAESALTGS
jgi:cellobiose-specific phosphotransferase system component IIA